MNVGDMVEFRHSTIGRGSIWVIGRVKTKGFVVWGGGGAKFEGFVIQHGHSTYHAVAENVRVWGIIDIVDELTDL